MANIEVSYTDMLIDDEALGRRLDYCNFQPVRVYFSIPDTIFVDTFVDKVTGKLLTEFPSQLLLNLLVKGMVVKIEGKSEGEV